MRTHSSKTCDPNNPKKKVQADHDGERNVWEEEVKAGDRGCDCLVSRVSQRSRRTKNGTRSAPTFINVASDDVRNIGSPSGSCSSGSRTTKRLRKYFRDEHGAAMLKVSPVSTDRSDDIAHRVRRLILARIVID